MFLRLFFTTLYGGLFQGERRRKMTNLMTFQVSGGGRFPMSMLRFDCCWPLTDEDANQIEATFDSHVRNWTVTLQTGARHSPTIGRWESFNCEVHPIYCPFLKGRWNGSPPPAWMKCQSEQERTAMNEFTFTEAFNLHTPDAQVKVSVTHQTETGKFLTVTFHEPRRDQMVSVPAEVWDMVVAAVQHHREF
jgi:hypothetical protein